MIPVSVRGLHGFLVCFEKFISYTESQSRILESYELEGTLEGPSSPNPCNEQGHLQLHQVAQSLALAPSGMTSEMSFTACVSQELGPGLS